MYKNRKKNEWQLEMQRGGERKCVIGKEYESERATLRNNKRV